MNAFKHHPNPEEAKVFINIKQNKKDITFFVRDDGDGIDEKFHDKIFEMFQTLQKKEEVDSTGVGLTLVKRIVEGVGGEIRVDSSVGSGASFIFSWPLKLLK